MPKRILSYCLSFLLLLQFAFPTFAAATSFNVESPSSVTSSFTDNNMASATSDVTSLASESSSSESFSPEASASPPVPDVSSPPRTSASEPNTESSSATSEEALPEPSPSATVPPASEGFFAPDGDYSLEAYNQILPEDLTRKDPLSPFSNFNDPSSVSARLSNVSRINNIVVFVRFADTPSEYINNTTIGYANDTYNVMSGSLKEFVSRLSYGSLDVNTLFFPQNSNAGAISYASVVTAHNRSYYLPSAYSADGYAPSQRFQREHELITDIMSKAQLSLSADMLDSNADSMIDNISFVFPLRSTDVGITHGSLLWPHKYNYLSGDSSAPKVGNVQIGSYNFLHTGSENYGMIGAMGRDATVMTHEFMHTLYLPDLYRYADMFNSPVGIWDLMDNGKASSFPGITDYFRHNYLKYGTEIPVVSSNRSITLSSDYANPAAQNSVCLKSPLRQDEYFIVEYRRNVGGDGRSSGLLVYRINEKISSSQGNRNANPKNNGESDFLYVFRPAETNYNWGQGSITQALLSPTNPQNWHEIGQPLGSANVTPNNSLYYTNASNSGIRISQITNVGEPTVTFQVEIPEPPLGSGTAADPFQVTTTAQFCSLASLCNGSTKYATLMNDLDFSNVPNYQIQADFNGVLNGNGHTLRNISCRTSGQAVAALFSSIGQGASISNLTIEHSSFSGESASSVLCYSLQGKIENIVIASTSVSATKVSAGSIDGGGRAGGIVGYLVDTGSIINCYSSASVFAQCAGGVTAYHGGGLLKNVLIDGKVSASASSSACGSIFGRKFYGTQPSASQVVWNVESVGQSQISSDQSSLAGCYGISVFVATTQYAPGQVGQASVFFTPSTPLSGTWVSSGGPLAIQPNGTFTASSETIGWVGYQVSAGTHKLTVSRPVTFVATPPGSFSEVEQFMLRLYRTCLGREPDLDGLRNNANMLVRNEINASGMTLAFFNSPEFASRRLSDEAFVTSVYYTLCDRPPDAAGMSNMLSALADGCSRNYIISQFIGSDEFTAICQRYHIIRGNYQSDEPRDQNRNVTAFMSRIYRKCLGREPDVNGLNGNVSMLLSHQIDGTGMVVSSFNSPEFLSLRTNDETFISTLYQVMCGRDPDAAGLASWRKILAQGCSRNYLIGQFSGSDEFTNICSRYNITRGIYASQEPRDQYPAISAFMTRIYRECLGREPDVTGLNGNVLMLARQEVTGAEMVSGALNSAEFLSKHLSNSDYIYTLYSVMCNRPPDPTGYNAWMSLLQGGKSRNYILANLVGSDEFTKICKQYDIPRGTLSL